MVHSVSGAIRLVELKRVNVPDGTPPMMVGVNPAAGELGKQILSWWIKPVAVSR